MAKTKGTPGPKPRYGERRDYHILLPLDLADKLDRASANGGVIAYVERVLREHFESIEQVKIGTLKYGYEEWERGLPPMPAPPDEK